MKNIYFPDEDITENDLYFVCYMIERTARKLHQHNRYVVEKLGLNGLCHQLSVANVNHSVNPLQVGSMNTVYLTEIMTLPMSTVLLQKQFPLLHKSERST